LRNPRRKPAQKTLEFLEQLLYNRHCIDFNAIYECSRVGLIVSKAKIVAVAAYVMTQIAGILILAVTCLWLYLSSPDIFSAMFADALSPGQELLLIQSIRNAVVASSAVLSPLFLWLTVRTVEKRRSI